jgi:PAS domain S-box-containing protein
MGTGSAWPPSITQDHVANPTKRGDSMTSPDALRIKILDAVLQPVWVVDIDGLIIFANPASVAMLGYQDAAELQGKSSHGTVHYKYPDGRPYPAAKCPMLAPRTTGKSGHGEDEWFVRPDGSMFPVAWWSAPIDLGAGRGAVLTFMDLTTQRAAEQAQRERDAAEIRAAESRAAQRRIVESTAKVRERMARDIHDGAQQQLVALLMELHLLRAELPGELAAQAQAAIDHASAAIGGLRALAAGMHPAILTTRGLFAAVETLAASAPLPVVTHGSPDQRLAQPVEVNAYFFVAEALTNAAKHARASRVDIELRVCRTELIVDVADDGIGGATLDGLGTGLSGLQDRVSALDGRFSLDSPPGGGTRLHAVIPLP